MFFDRELRQDDTSINEWPTIYSQENGYETVGKNLKEITYFSCLKIISESIAKCKLNLLRENDGADEVVKGNLNQLLSLRPNPYMTAIDAFKTFVLLGEHYGISGLYIERRGLDIVGMHPVKITNVTVDNAGLISSSMENRVLWDWESINEQGSSFDKDLIIYKGFTLDGINTKANRVMLKESLDTSIRSQNYLNTLFVNGLTNKVTVQLTSDLKEEKDLKRIQEKFNKIYSSTGKIFTVPAGYNVSALNLSLADAQFEQLRRLSREEIASALGVPLTKLGLVKENAKSEEMDNIKFLQDTLMVRFENVEQEMDYKLLTQEQREQGHKIRFNIDTLLRMDAETQAKVISQYVKNGVYSINEARKIRGMKKIEYGDHVFMPSGQVSVKQIVEGTVSYAKKGGEPSDK